jgi:sphingomyelin phosphodiesterase acid-like 3
MLFLSPAVTPWKSTLPGVGSNNPSIRLYEYNQQTYEILNYHQYYLNLSSVLTAKVANWEKEYDAKKDYNLTSLNADSFTLAAKTFRSDPVLFKKYLQFNSVSQNLNPKCNETCQNVHFCSITELRTKNFKVCLNNHQTTTTVDPTPQHSTTTVDPTPQHSTTPEPKEPVSQTMIIIICTLAGAVFVCAVVVAILCIKRHIIFIPHRYSRFSSPLSKGPIN